MHIRIWKYIENLLDAIFVSMISAHKAERILNDKINMLDDDKEVKSDIEVETLKAYNNKYDNYKRDIEGKAKINLLGITLSFSIVFTGLTFILGHGSTLFQSTLNKFIAFPLFVIGIIYLILSGLISLKVYRIGEWNDITIDDELVEKAERAAILKNCLEKNEIILINKRNYTYVSQMLIRNGIIAISIFIIALVIQMILSI